MGSHITDAQSMQQSLSCSCLLFAVSCWKKQLAAEVLLFNVSDLYAQAFTRHHLTEHAGIQQVLPMHREATLIWTASAIAHMDCIQQLLPNISDCCSVS